MPSSNKRMMYVVSGVVHIVKSRGTILVDETDYALIPGRRLTIDKEGYARVSIFRQKNGKCRMTGLHRLIMNAPSWMQVDHINHNPFDNRRCNLRLCTGSQNAANSRGQSKRKSLYKGVWFNPKSKRDKCWRASTKENRRTRHLGGFATPEEAAVAYNQHMLARFGKFACLNVIQHRTQQQLLAI